MKMLNNFYIYLFFILFIVDSVKAQDTTLYKKNLVKMNITSPLIYTFALSYERVLDNLKTLQVSIFYRDRPNTETQGLPTNVTGWGITPELRFYLSKNRTSPLGFFAAPYLTYQRYLTTEEVRNLFFRQLRNVTSNVYGLGVAIGGQWTFKKVLSLDIWGGLGYYQVSNDANSGAFITGTNYRKGTSYSGRIGMNVGFAF